MPTPTLLEHHPLLVNLEPSQLEHLANAGEVESYNPGEAIVVEGSLGDALFLILSGQCAVHKGAQTFATLQGGEFFGEMSLIDEGPRSATARVKGAAELIVITKKSFRDMLQNDPRVAAKVLLNLLKVANQRLRRTTELIKHV